MGRYSVLEKELKPAAKFCEIINNSANPIVLTRDFYGHRWQARIQL